MIKESDLKIMAALRKDARQTLTSISKQTKIPVSTIYDRIRKHENGVIKKHTSILDFPRMGYNIRLNFLLKVKNQWKFKEFISKHKNVNSAFRVEGEFNFMMDCIFKQMNEMQSFTEKIEEFGIEKKQTNFIIEEVVRENFMNMGVNEDGK